MLVWKEMFVNIGGKNCKPIKNPKIERTLNKHLKIKKIWRYCPLEAKEEKSGNIANYRPNRG